MNEYEKAWFWIARSIGEHGWFDEEEVGIVKKLVERATAMKVKIVKGINGKLVSLCPQCNVDVIADDFCSFCGQALNWSDSNE